MIPEGMADYTILQIDLPDASSIYLYHTNEVKNGFYVIKSDAYL